MNKHVNVRVKNVYSDLDGIYGWLLFPAFGLVLALIFGLSGAINLWAISDEIHDTELSGVVSAHGSIVFVIWIYTLIAAIWFFKKNRKAKSAMIVLYLINVVGSFLILIIVASTNYEEYINEVSMSFLRSIVAACIWVPYFIFSKRVKQTFVN